MADETDTPVRVLDAFQPEIDALLEAIDRLSIASKAPDGDLAGAIAAAYALEERASDLIDALQAKRRGGTPGKSERLVIGEAA